MKKWNKLLALLLAMVMAFGMTATAFAEGEDATEPSYEGWDTIKVFTTTDVHGNFLKISNDPSAFEYRMPYIAKLVADARADEAYDDVLLLDGGDSYQGTPQSAYGNGSAMRAILDTMGYDAVALGNHEFDWDVVNYITDSQGTLASYEVGEYKGDSEIPVLASNLYDAETGERVNFTQDYTVVEKAGYKVAILGYVSEYSKDIMAAKIAPYTIDGDLAKLSEKAKTVREETDADVLVVLAHGTPDVIAEAMDPEVVDLVVGGHTHARTCGVAENGISYIQGYKEANGYATAEIKIDPETRDVVVVDPVFNYLTAKGENAKLYYNDGANELLDPAVLDITTTCWDAIAEEMTEVLCTVDADITKDPIQEGTTTTTAGNWLAGLMLEVTKEFDTVAAFTNSGGIRVNLTREEGQETRNITAADVYTISPFGNMLYTVPATGAQIAAQVELALQGSYDNSNYGDQFSGIVVTYYKTNNGIKVTGIVTDDGETIDINDTTKTYNICLNQYNATLDGSPFEGVKALQEDAECPIDNESFVAALRAMREANGPEMELDTTVRAVEEPAPSSGYDDVTVANWHFEPVLYVTEKGLIDGLTETTFGPNESMTRADFVTALYRLAGSPEVSGKNIFSDVADDAAYLNAVIWANNMGYVNGNPDGTFDPNGTLQRQQIAAILYRVVKPEAAEGDLSAFTDADSVQSYAAEAVKWMVAVELLQGNTNGTIDARGPISRAQVATILMRFEEKGLTFAVGTAEKAHVISVSKYGNITTDIPVDAFTEAGFEVGDILTITVGETTVDAPYGTGYSNVDTGSPIILANKYGYIEAAINMGNFAKTYGVEVNKSVLSFAMGEKAGYLEEYEIRNIDALRTNVREDYASDEIFANFRNVVMGDLAEGVLYRSSSPVNPELGRSTYADELIEAAGVKTVINLADSEEEMKAYEGFADTYYSTLNIVNLNMGVDFKAEDFAAKLKTGLEFMIANEGPYLVHCTEGKDRAGFVNALLSALMGGTLEEIKADYMTSFENYYGVEKDSDRYDRIAESNILSSLRMIAGLEEGADLTAVDLAAAAEGYLTGTVGLTAEQVTALRAALCPVAAEQAA